ncbi:MAG: YHS domain-containing protein [bacterium]|nr:MAG: YHS domain-containing protein [bacterium]
MKGYFVISILISLMAIFSCSSEKQAEVQMEAEQHTMDQSIDITADMLTTKIDLICDMDLTKHAIKDTTIYKDQLYGFCSSYCKEKFLEDPEAAIAKLEAETE